MKIHNGFISNSSSCSYVVEIRGIDKTGFVSYLLPEYAWDYFNSDKIKEEVEKEIQKCKDEKLNADKNKETKGFDNGGFLQEIMNRRQSFLEEIKGRIENNVNDETLVETVLKYNSIDFNQTEDGIELQYFTSMHNDFNEGMSDLLKEIVLFFVFDHKMKVICRRENDSGN